MDDDLNISCPFHLCGISRWSSLQLASTWLGPASSGNLGSEPTGARSSCVCCSAFQMNKNIFNLKNKDKTLNIIKRKLFEELKDFLGILGHISKIVLHKAHLRI